MGKRETKTSMKTHFGEIVYVWCRERGMTLPTYLTWIHQQLLVPIPWTRELGYSRKMINAKKTRRTTAARISWKQGRGRIGQKGKGNRE